jgi:hypothetical protein
VVSESAGFWSSSRLDFAAVTAVVSLLPFGGYPLGLPILTGHRQFFGVFSSIEGVMMLDTELFCRKFNGILIFLFLNRPLSATFDPIIPVRHHEGARNRRCGR